jgi:hypothetical protein
MGWIEISERSHADPSLIILATSCPPETSNRLLTAKEALVSNTASTISKMVGTASKVVGTASLLMVGYVLLSALPDLRRYVRISLM